MFTAVSVSPNEIVQPDDIPTDPPQHYGLNTVVHDAPPPGVRDALSPNVGGGTLHDTSSVTSDGSGSSAGDSTDLEALIKTPLQLGQTLIVYHPHVQHPPEIVDTATLSLTREPEPSHFSTSPWVPFKSRDDFEQTELFIKYNCNDKLINDQLHLNRKRDSHNHGPGDPNIQPRTPSTPNYKPTPDGPLMASLVG